MKTTIKTQENRPELSFDGFGINGPDEYRTRLCTFSKGASEDDRKKYGALFEAAPELLEALKGLFNECTFYTYGEARMETEPIRLNMSFHGTEAWKKAKSILEKAEGKAVQS